jgi:hypothetical protein
VSGTIYGQPVSGYPYVFTYGYQWVTAPPPPPRRRHRVLRWIATVLGVLVVCASLVVGGVVGYADYTGLLDYQASWQDGAKKVDLPPAQDAPSGEWRSWARRAIDDALTTQAKALLDGDQAAYLAVADPSATALVADQTRRYKALHAMGLGQWTEAVTGSVTENGARSWSADIKISYCFGTKTCEPVQIVEASEWTLQNDHIALAKVTNSTAEWNGPRPWEADELTVQTGQRVVMAATKANAWRLPDAVRSADRAALVADKLAKWEAPPGRYVIFLAGPSDWTKWYGHTQPEWAAAWAVPVGDTVTEVVVRTQVVQQRGLETLLTHELTHVTTLAGKRYGANRSSWWLIEGIAEYATMIGKPISDYDAIPPTRSYVRSKWDGDPDVDAPTASASLEEASARYGIAFLAVRRIADKYGQDRMLDFFGKIVHDDDDLDRAATGALGASWATVKTDCAKYIRSALG